MNYTYTEYKGNKKIEFRGDYAALKQWFINYCHNNIRMNVRYISRSFDGILGDNGAAYTASCVFDYDHRLTGYYFKRIKDRTSVVVGVKPQPHKYELSNIVTLEYCNTHEEVKDFMRKHPDERFTLTNTETKQWWHLRYNPETQMLTVGCKDYRI